MKRLYLTIICSFFLSYITSSAQNERPKVALVLSGGGAKGAAHVGALKVIEKAGIKPDMIVGTSMGALIGGLYAVGYTPEQLDSILRSQDWKVLLSDSEDPKNNTLSENLTNKDYAITYPFNTKRLSINDGGLIRGINLGHVFHQLLYPYTYNMKSFDKLPVPFSCVAVDIVTGRPYEFHSGSLQDAMRASMSIPGVFTPVRLDSMILVDGGLRDNYPTDVALRMGADIIIGVSVQSDLKDYSHINGISEVLSQVMDVAMSNPQQGGAHQTDVNIQVNVKGYTAASFTPGAIDTLLTRGEEAALSHFYSLDSLSDVLAEAGHNKTFGREPRPVISMEASRYMELEEPTLPVTLYSDYSDNTARVSLRYDNINNVALLLGGDLRLPTHRYRTFLDATIRLGEHNYFKPQIRLDLNRRLSFRLGYEYHRLKQDLYYDSELYATLRSCNWHRIVGGTSFNWKHSYLRFNIDFNALDGELLVSEQRAQYLDTHFCSYSCDYSYNTYDSQNFPTRGINLTTGYKMATTGLLSNSNKHPMHIIYASLSGVLLSKNHLSLIPRVSYRTLINTNDDFLPLHNYMGGLLDANLFDGQRSFAGMTHMQVNSTGSVFIAAMDASYNILKKHFVFATANLGWDCDDGEKLFHSGFIYGMKAGYMIRSIIGPLSFELHYSNLESYIKPMVNIGFLF